MNWENKSIELIIGGNAPDGTRYLVEFLKDYASLTGEKTLNASCNNCIREYHRKYIQKMKPSNCDYKLKDKYNGIPLGRGSSVLITNANITNDLGAELLKNRGSHLFVKFPITETEKLQEIEAPKVKRRGRKPKTT